jgi:hypothetical protein
MINQDLVGAGQFEALSHPLEKRQSNHAFERLNRPADRRRCYIKRLGSPSDRAELSVWK